MTAAEDLSVLDELEDAEEGYEEPEEVSVNEGGRHVLTVCDCVVCVFR
jgi:hypothetical protein